MAQVSEHRARPRTFREKPGGPACRVLLLSGRSTMLTATPFSPPMPLAHHSLRPCCPIEVVRTLPFGRRSHTCLCCENLALRATFSQQDRRRTCVGISSGGRYWVANTWKGGTAPPSSC